MNTVLCIEDERDLRELIVEELEDADYNVLEATDGQKGLEVILSEKPDIVVSDINMPNLTGLELVKALRTNHPEFAEIPFLFLSAYSDREQIIEGLKVGADDYLTKPVDLELLLVKVETSLRQ